MAQRSSLVQEIDFSETFAQMVRWELLQIDLALCLILNLFIYQVDIVDAYLKSFTSDIQFPIFINLPSGMNNLCYIWQGLPRKLLKSLYDLKQSRRLCNQTS